MEMTKAFEIMSGKVETELLKRGFQKQPVADSDKEITALYTGEDVAYSLVYYTDKKRILLRSCSMIENEPDNNWKTTATWLFDPDVDGVKDAENIGDDFVETIKGPKQIAVQQQSQRKKKKDNDGNVDSLFFANRMVAYFPELKQEIAYEKAHYTAFRGVTFAEEKIVPKFKEYVASANEKALTKLSKNISDFYNAGDLDVKGIITYILLNSVDDDNKFEQLISEFRQNEQKIARAARKLRGKNIKPEKVKKPKKYIADNLTKQ